MSITEGLRELCNTPGFDKFIQVKRRNLLSQVHEIVFFGKGGYTWETVYMMPVPYRRFVYAEMTRFYEHEAEQARKIQEGKSLTPPPKQITTPGIKKPDMQVSKTRATR